MDLGVKLNIGRISSLIHLLAERVPNLYLTKLLKLLYIIDETAVVESGVPITWLRYRVWKRGPVAKFVFDEIKFFDGVCISDKVTITKDEFGLFLKPLAPFKNYEFSKYELSLFERVIKDYGSLNSEKLVEITHKENGLWDNMVKKYNLNEKFSDEDNTSPFSIDFTELIKDSPLMLMAYESAKDALLLQAELEGKRELEHIA